VADRLTRRQLLVRGAGAAGAALLLDGLPTAGAQAPPGTGTTVTTTGPPAVGLPSERMLKGVSLIGAVNPYDDSLGVRPYLLGGARPTEVVNFWIVWPEVQPVAPAPLTLAASFAQLSDANGPAAAKIAALDAQIAQANRDGRRVGLTLYQAFADWAHPSRRLDPAMERDNGGPGYPGQGKLGNGAYVPDDRGEDGPWAWFVAWCCARWADTGGEPTPGAGLGVSVGNPQGARLDWLQPLNEPNLVWWPQRSERYPDGTIASAVAEMMRSAAAVAARYRNGPALPQGPELLMPNTADVVSGDSDHGTPWRDFTRELAARLTGWAPPTPVGWSQHNYADVKYGPQEDGPERGRWRAQEAIELLRAARWPDPALWLTEGGYQFGVRATAPTAYVVDPSKTADPAAADVFAEQVARLTANWEAMENLPVRLWSQYLVNDLDVRFQSSLRGPARPDPNGTMVPFEPPYPAYALWPTLGA
jgi:hypothetical protein